MTDQNKRNDDSLIPIEIVDDFEAEAALLGKSAGTPRAVAALAAVAVLAGGYVALGQGGGETAHDRSMLPGMRP